MEEFFESINMNTSDSKIQKRLANCFKTAQTKGHHKNIMKLVFHLRDCRGGKGLKHAFYVCIHWMVDNGYVSLVREHLWLVPHYGYWKDLLQLCDIPSMRQSIIQLFAFQLIQDRLTMLTGKRLTSLCAKYAPTEGCSFDKRFKIVSEISKSMGITKKDYRKVFITPIREYLNIPEKLMCSQKYNDIDLTKVPALFLLRNQEALYSNEPHKLMEATLKPNKLNLDHLCFEQIIKEQSWPSLTKERLSLLKKKLANKNIRGVVAIHERTPENVKLAKMFSKVMADPFKNQVVVLSPQNDSAKLLFAKQLTPLELKHSTKLKEDLFWDFIEEKCRKYNVPKEQIPEHMILVSKDSFEPSTNSYSFDFNSTTKLFESKRYDF